MSVPHPKNGKFRDLTGQRFSRLVALEYVGRGRSRESLWRCACDCGNETTVPTSALTSGNTTSCGCFGRERRLAVVTKHGGCPPEGSTPEYRTWAGIIQRCTNPKNPAYPNYGGRGITVDPRWVTSFAVFLAVVGPKPFPGAELDRIDNARGYEPGNVKWTTRTQNQRNKRNNVVLEFRGERMASSAWAERYGMNQATLESRLRWGWTVERALLTPVNRWKPGRNPRTKRGA